MNNSTTVLVNSTSVLDFNTQNNVTASETDSTTIGVLYTVSSTLVMISNGVVITVIAKSQSLHLPTLLNIAFMAAFDFLHGLYFLVFVVPSAFVGTFIYSERLILPAACLLTLITGQNIFNILVATVDRYLSLCWPLHYNRLMTTHRFLLANSITICMNIVRLCVISLPVDVGFHHTLALPMFRISSGVGSVVVTGLPCITGVLIVGVLVKLFVEMGRSRYRARSGKGSVAVFQSFTIAISLSAVALCACYAPLCVTILYIVFNKKPAPAPLQQFTCLCMLSNSLINVFIYGAVYKPFREEFLRLFCPQYFRRKRQIDICNGLSNGK